MSIDRSPSRRSNNLMSLGFCEGRESSGKYQCKDKEYSYGIRARGDRPYDGEMVEKPYGYDQKNQYHYCDCHRGTRSDSVSVVVMYVCIVSLLLRLLLMVRR